MTATMNPVPSGSRPQASTAAAAATELRGQLGPQGVAGQSGVEGGPPRRAVPLQARTAEATVLVEPLPWLNPLHGHTGVVKYGGHVMTEDSLRHGFAQEVVFLRCVWLRAVVVHGGGPQISAHLARLGLASTFAAG